jgi:hypothetical protein
MMLTPARGHLPGQQADAPTDAPAGAAESPKQVTPEFRDRRSDRLGDGQQRAPIARATRPSPSSRDEPVSAHDDARIGSERDPELKPMLATSNQEKPK